MSLLSFVRQLHACIDMVMGLIFLFTISVGLHGPHYSNDISNWIYFGIMELYALDKTSFVKNALLTVLHILEQPDTLAGVL